MTALKQTLENHRKEAQESHKYYTEVIANCSSEWKEMAKLEEMDSVYS